jgi:ribosomal protein S18 acetylase RimI-like enzyme
MRWQLRPATALDEEALYEIHRAAMREHVAAIWGWEEADQRARFRASFDAVHTSVIIVSGAVRGLLRLEDRGHELFLASIELAPEAQRAGIGSDIIRSILRDGAQRRVPVRLQVFRQNPARRLYERLGFHVVGETTTHVEMVHEQKSEDAALRGEMKFFKMRAWSIPTIVRISSDGRALDIERASDAETVRAPVLDRCGDPAVGSAKICDSRLSQGNAIVTYGKRCSATISLKTLAIECTGCD